MDPFHGSVGGGGGVGVVYGQSICYHVATFEILLNLICNMNFDLLTPSPRVVWVWGVSAGKTFATMLLHFVIPFNLICNMTMF